MNAFFYWAGDGFFLSSFKFLLSYQTPDSRTACQSGNKFTYILQVIKKIFRNIPKYFLNIFSTLMAPAPRICLIVDFKAIIWITLEE